MSLVIYILILVTMFFLIKKIKLKRSIWEWILLGITLVIFNIPGIEMGMIDTSNNKYLGVLLSISVVLSILFNSKVDTEHRVSAILRMISPMLSIFWIGIDNQLAFIFAVVIYILLNDELKDTLELLLSYIIIGLGTIKYFLTSYFDSPLSIVNYQVQDIFDYTLVLVAFLSLLNTMIALKRWNRWRNLHMMNVFWPTLFLSLSFKLQQTAFVYEEYIVMITAALGILVLISWRNKLLIASVTAVISLLFVTPYLYLIAILLLVLYSLRKKAQHLKKVFKLEYMDLLSVVILIVAIRHQIESLGLVSVMLFLFVVRNMKSELEFE